MNRRTSPSSDSGIHSLGEQWEDTSLITTDTEEEQNRTSRIRTPTGRRVSVTCVPPNTEEDQVTLCPWIDCLLNQESEESPEIDMLDSDSESEWNESEEIYSDQEISTNEHVYADYETWTYPVAPPDVSKLQKTNSAEQCEYKSSVGGETDGGNSDICNLADFSSDDEYIPVERNSGYQSVNIIGVAMRNYNDLSDFEISEWQDAENRAVRSMIEHRNCDLIDRLTPVEYAPIP